MSTLRTWTSILNSTTGDTHVISPQKAGPRNNTDPSLTKQLARVQDLAKLFQVREGINNEVKSLGCLMPFCLITSTYKVLLSWIQQESDKPRSFSCLQLPTWKLSSSLFSGPHRYRSGSVGSPLAPSALPLHSLHTSFSQKLPS